MQQTFARVSFCITSIVLYSTGHWIGATIALIVFLLINFGSENGI